MKTAYNSGSSGADGIFYTSNEAFEAGWRSEYANASSKTIMRLYPHFAGNVPEPQLIEGKGQGQDMIGDFMAEYQIIRYFGPDGFSGIVEVTDPTPGTANPVSAVVARLLDLQRTNGAEIVQSGDGHMLNVYNKIFGKWVLDKKDRSGKNDKRPTCLPPEPALFLRGSISLLRGKQPENFVSKQPENREKCIMRIAKSGKDSLIKALTTVIDTSQPLSVENSEMGDIIGPNGYSVAITAADVVGQGGMTYPSYSVTKEAAVALDPNYVFSQLYDNGMYCDWARLMYRPTVADLIMKLKLACGEDVIAYALGAHPVYGQYVQAAPIHITPAAAPVAAAVAAPVATAPVTVGGQDPRIAAMVSAGMPEGAIAAAATAMGLVYPPVAVDPQVAAMRAAGMPEEAIQAAMAAMAGIPAAAPTPEPAPAPTQAQAPAPTPVTAPVETAAAMPSTENVPPVTTAEHPPPQGMDQQEALAKMQAQLAKAQATRTEEPK